MFNLNEMKMMEARQRYEEYNHMEHDQAIKEVEAENNARFEDHDRLMPYLEASHRQQEAQQHVA